VAGSSFEYGILAAERSAALARLADLRKPADSSAQETHYRDFMIAELFLFRLETVDSALGHLDRIVQDPRQDSTHTMRAAYARAFIQDEFKQAKPVSDSLYRYVLEKYPNTEYAKQSERNLGLKPSVQTDEDNAHKLFLEAEAIRFGGGELRTAVIPAYAKVVAQHGSTRDAAKAQFVIAMIYEQMANGEEKVPGSLDSAISAHQSTRERYPQTPYGMASDTKLAAANIKPRPKGPAPTAAPTTAPTAPASAPGAPATGATSTTAPAAAPGTPAAAAPGTPAAVPATGVPVHEQYRGGRHSTESTPPSTETPPAADTASATPEGKTKEELDNDYENVDQY
jgi:outer membrane protein assembly factor BamD (BamD/ComL family)